MFGMGDAGQVLVQLERYLADGREEITEVMARDLVGQLRAKRGREVTDQSREYADADQRDGEAEPAAGETRRRDEGEGELPRGARVEGQRRSAMGRERAEIASSPSMGARGGREERRVGRRR